MTRTITIDMLRAEGACDDQLAEFECRFPAGVTFADEADAITQCVAVAGVFKWGWAAENLLTARALKAYKAAVVPAWEVYKAARARAWEAYEAATAPAWEAYEAAMDPARKAYEAATAPAWEAYEAAEAPAWEAYEAAVARARKAYEAAEARAFAVAFMSEDNA